MLSVPCVTSLEQVEVPALIYGTAWKAERTAGLVEQAVAAGFKGIDTACQPKHYNEPGVGEALAKLKQQGIPRDSLYLQTKFTPLSGQDPNNIPYDPSLPLPRQVAQSFETSTKNLRTDYLDSLLLHSPLQSFNATMEVWGALEKIRREGGTRQLGISNCYDPALLQQLYQQADIKPAVVQNRFYADTGYDSELRSWCKEQGIIYQSFWTLTANTHVLSALAVGRIAEKYHCEPTQVLLRYVTQLGIVPLTGTTSAEHMREDLQMFNFELDEGEMDNIDKLLGAGA